MRALLIGTAAIFGVAVIMALQAPDTKTHREPYSPKNPPPTNLPPTQPQGSPAIAATVRRTPAFTLEDVRKFVASHTMESTKGRIAAKLIRARFLSSAAASAAFDDIATGFPDDHLLCVAEVEGPLVFPAPPGAKVVYPHGVLVFDATNGNLVITGGLP